MLVSEANLQFTTWMTHKHFEFNMYKTEFSAFFYTGLLQPTFPVEVLKMSMNSLTFLSEVGA